MFGVFSLLRTGSMNLSQLDSPILGKSLCVQNNCIPCFHRRSSGKVDNTLPEMTDRHLLRDRNLDGTGVLFLGCQVGEFRIVDSFLDPLSGLLRHETVSGTKEQIYCMTYPLVIHRHQQSAPISHTYGS